MKTLTILFLFPLKLIAQDIAGIWTGFIQTTGNKLPYELVISEQKDKLTGYSLTVFVFDGVENIGVKSIKLKNKNGSVSIEDNELVYNNYTTPPKRVQLLGRLSLKINDSVSTLNGSFTTRSLDFRELETNPFSGTIYLQKQNNFAQTKLIAKLDELQLLNIISFIQPKTKEKEEIASVNPLPGNVKSTHEKEILKETVQATQKVKDTHSVNAPVSKIEETAKIITPLEKNKPLPGEIKKETVSTNTKTIDQQKLNEQNPIKDDLASVKVNKEQVKTPQDKEKETASIPIKEKGEPNLVVQNPKKDETVNANLPKEHVKTPHDKEKETVSSPIKAKEQPGLVVQKPKKDETTIVNVPKEQIKISQPKEIVSAPIKAKEQPGIIEQKPKKDETVSANVPKEQIKIQSKEKETVSVPVKVKEQPGLVEQKPKKDETAIASLPKEQIKPPLQKEKEKTSDSVSALVKSKEQPVLVEQKPKESVTIQSSATGIKPALSSQATIAAVDIDSRKTEIIRTVFYKSDSLVVSLYDNGEIDGDVVSVVLNGRVIIAQNELNASPIRIVINITPEIGDSLHFIMYAENLGKIPPNTGLLILQDGDERHEIRFAGDLQKNSGIILKRRR